MSSILSGYQKHAKKILLCNLICLVFRSYTLVLSGIPSQMYIENPGEAISLGIPVSLETIEVNDVQMADSILRNKKIDMSMQTTSYTCECKLFHIFPVKKVELIVRQPDELYACGQTVGIYVQTDGVLVLGTGKVTTVDGETISPSEHLLQTGDYITKVNNQAVETKEQLIREVNSSQGERVELEIKRNGESIDVAVTPANGRSGAYQLGVWVRDDLAGLGTITYIDGSGEYGALGHGVSDADIGEKLSVRGGGIYHSDITGISVGTSGTAGEIKGLINYSKNAWLGTIEENSDIGIYGKIKSNLLLEEGVAKLPTCRYTINFKQNIKLGAAQILSSVNGEIEKYQINITGVNYDDTKNYREIEFEVVDEELIALTGGIVQGMSGSPILQDEKLIGAVTHVLVNNPREGYGIFIENMLGH